MNHPSPSPLPLVRRRTLVLVPLIALLMGAAACSTNSSTQPKGSTSTSSQPSTASASPDATTIANDMIANGIPASIGFTYSAANDPSHLLGHSGSYTSKISFQDSRLATVHDFTSPSSSPTAGGAALECFSTSDAASKRFTFLQDLSGTTRGDTDDILVGTCILRIGDKLSPTQAIHYRRALKAATGRQ